MIQRWTNSVIGFDKLNVWKFPIHEGTPATHPFIDGISHYQPGYPVPHCWKPSKNRKTVESVASQVGLRRKSGRTEIGRGGWGDDSICICEAWCWKLVETTIWPCDSICDFRGVGQPPACLCFFLKLCWNWLNHTDHKSTKSMFILGDWRLERSACFCNSWASSWEDPPVSSWLRSLFRSLMFFPIETCHVQ